jgi:hypothetical protein
MTGYLTILCVSKFNHRSLEQGESAVFILNQAIAIEPQDRARLATGL